MPLSAVNGGFLYQNDARISILLFELSCTKRLSEGVLVSLLVTL